MKIEVLFLIVIILFSATLILVNGAGGGGGGGNGGGGGGNGGTTGSSGGGTNDNIPEFSKVKCFDDGRIELQMKDKEDIIAFKKDDGDKIKVSGDWSRKGNFKSDEAIFIDKGEYNITKGDITRTFDCPGLILACSIVELKNIYCKDSNDGLIAGFKITNEPNIDNLKFNFIINKKVVSYTSDSYNSLLKGLKVELKGEDVILTTFDKLGAKEFEVLHTKCIGKKYIYSRVSCSESNQVIEIINSNELKCGGLLELNDRVRCRINLESEKDEYENFYPEECRNHKDSNKCLSIYRSVSECWDIPGSNGRINCLKNKINYGDVQKERNICADVFCKKEVNEKIFTMIKLRFYNLEEQAEILEERGLLDEEDLIDFVVKIENKKLEFNEALTKKEMKDIILSVKDMYKELVRGIK